MAIKTVLNEWCPPIGDHKKEFILDEAADVASLPPCGVGSTAFVIETSTAYMINSNGEWKEI